MDFAFNMSLSTINVTGQFGKEYDVDLPVSDVKMLLHNASMVERIFSMFGKRPNKQKREGLTFGQSLSIIQLMRKRDYFLK